MGRDSELYETLVKTIKESIPKGESVINRIAEILKIEKESVYRRLRGDVLFTFEEIAALSSRLGFSIDKIADANNKRHALFELKLLNLSPDHMLTYKELIGYYSAHFQHMNVPSGHVRIATNSMPYILLLFSPVLSKFRIYKWMYQIKKNDPFFSFSDFVMPKEIIEVHEQFTQSIQKTPLVTLILDRNVFTSFIRDINYFYKRKLINDMELEELKQALLEVIDFLEDVTTNGINRYDGRMDVYISAVDIEELYVHLEYDNIEVCNLRIFSIDALNSANIEICRAQKKWIESLKKFSVLISYSSEMQRFQYLNKQREYVRNLGNVHEDLDFS